jgi:hypothetical protein
VPRPWPDWSREGSGRLYLLRPPLPFLARFREAERRALLRLADLRPLEPLRALFRAERPPFLAALARLADLRPPFLARFLLDRLADLLAVFLRARLRGRLGLALVGDGSSVSL